MKDSSMHLRILYLMKQIQKRWNEHSEKKMLPHTSTIEIYQLLIKDYSVDISIPTVDRLLNEIAISYTLPTTKAYFEYKGKAIRLEYYTIVFLTDSLNEIMGESE
ncbi:MAG: hypothetical protein IKQ80_08525 [Clostridia bacterium]|nr:hypothetical protein [Clostridia bacterium]